MWIRIRSLDGKVVLRLDDLSKLTKIAEVRKKLQPHFDAAPQQLRLIYSGKELVDEHSLFDYGVQPNGLVQVMVRPILEERQKTPDDGFFSAQEKDDADSDTGSRASSAQEEQPTVEATDYYKVGDLVEILDLEGILGWQEGKIVKITPKPSTENAATSHATQANETEPSSSSPTPKAKPSLFDDNGLVLENADDGWVYHVVYERFVHYEAYAAPFSQIRPRAWFKLKFSDLSEGQTILANYNVSEPKKLGHWFHATVVEKTDRSRTSKELKCQVYPAGEGRTYLDDCKLVHLDEFYRIERPTLLAERDEEQEYRMQKGEPPQRPVQPSCDVCKDQMNVKCMECSCCACGGKEKPGSQVVCDECDKAYHIWCLKPPLEAIPEDDDWFCPECKVDVSEVVGAGQKLKASKKKAKMAHAVNKSTRDWGKGMACAGRTKVCTLVPKNHFGEIPGVEVGSSWLFRVQCSESGCHRPHVAGIAGRGNEGAYSIVLAGGYEDDVDNGEEFYYTGSGGRDLTGNKRTARQSSNQTLTNMNKALALNCDAPLNSKKGAEAGNWKSGKPVRVLRTYKGKKHSKYSPDEGVRYDGIYKVVKYWPEKGQSGFIVWRYLMRRDDKIPAPWTKQGKERIKKLGLKMVYPEGKKDKEEKEENVAAGNTPGKRNANDDDLEKSSKRLKLSAYELAKDVKKLISSDTVNKRVWNETLECVTEGQKAFLDKVEELFLCVCCQEVVFQPVTTECQHNVCQPCLKRAFKVTKNTCPVCRFVHPNEFQMKINNSLFMALKALFPGYERTRD